MIYLIAETIYLQMRGKSAKTYNLITNKVGKSQPCFLFAKFFQLFLQKVLTLCICCGIIVLQIDTRKESEMSKKIKVNISLAPEIYEIGKHEAERMGIPFSTYLSVLIANQSQTKNERRK